MTTMTKRSITVAITVLALVLTFAAAAFAALTKEVPFKEELRGAVTNVLEAEDFFAGDTFGGRCSVPSQMLISMAGTGIVNHMGRVSWTGEHCTQLFAGTFGDADVVITAANGDKLYGTYSGWFTGETSFAELMTILGGTGRFAGATGSVDEVGSFDPDTSALEIHGDGWILYDASQRANH